MDLKAQTFNFTSMWPLMQTVGNYRTLHHPFFFFLFFFKPFNVCIVLALICIPSREYQVCHWLFQYLPSLFLDGSFLWRHYPGDPNTTALCSLLWWGFSNKAFKFSASHAGSTAMAKHPKISITLPAVDSQVLTSISMTFCVWDENCSCQYVLADVLMIQWL